MEYNQLWSINSAGWHVERNENLITLSPCDVAAAITVGIFYRNHDTFTEEEILEMAQKGAPLDAERLPVICGDFVGFYTEYCHEDEEGKAYLRVWWLFHTKIHLYITYNCDAEYKDTHREVIDWMLGTLKDKSRNEVVVNGA